jgi:hypothetical protein
MREIQRYIITTSAAGLATGIPSDDGPWCSYRHVESYRRQYRIAIVTAVLVAMVCGLLSALLVHEKASRSPVQVPIGAAEKAALLAELAVKEKIINDLKAQKSFYEAQIRHKNAAIANTQAQIDIVAVRGVEIDKLNKEQAQRMSTHQGVVLEAKRVLGVNVKVME